MYTLKIPAVDIQKTFTTHEELKSISILGKTDKKEASKVLINIILFSIFALR